MTSTAWGRVGSHQLGRAWQRARREPAYGAVPGVAGRPRDVVGVVEIVAGLAVALKPRYAAYMVAAWLVTIIVNLVSYPGFYDVALRDFGLLLAALALARLAVVCAPAGPGRLRRRAAVSTMPADREQRCDAGPPWRGETLIRR